MITSSGDGHPDEAIMYETARSDSMRELAYREGGGPRDNASLGRAL